MQVIYQNNIMIFNSYDCYSATYGPISMKLYIIVKSHRSHVLTKFRKVLSFRLGFIGFWVYVAMPLL